MHAHAVRSTYETWIYPEPIDDLEAAQRQGYAALSDPSASGDLYWPAQRSLTDIDILVAGCGANQAAFVAYKNPSARVLGLDLSSASLAHGAMLKQKHGLDNLELRRLPIEQAAELDRTFDLILSTGVLHHTPAPQLGLNVLAGLLREQGVISLMVYGDTLRAGVYMVQEAFRALDLSQTPEDVAFAREALDALPASHTVQSYIRSAERDLRYDGAIVDTFLHPLDKCFSVSDIRSWLAGAELEFLSWLLPWRYRPQSFFDPQSALFQRLRGLDELTQSHVVDKLTQRTGSHRFCAAKPAYAQGWRALREEGDVADALVRLHSKSRLEITGPRGGGRLVAEGLGKVSISPFAAAFLQKCEGGGTAKQALRQLLGAQPMQQQHLDDLSAVLRALQRLGHVRLVWPA